MIRLFVTVEGVDAVIDAGYTVIRVYTDVTEGGTFTTLDGTITLVAATESYEYTDLDGTSATWYKTAYWGAVPGEGDKSEALQGSTSVAYGTVKELRAEIGKTITTDDVELAALLDAAAENINRFCNRPDGFLSDGTAAARLYVGSGTGWQRIDECTGVTQVRVRPSATSDYETWTSADYILCAGDDRFPNFNPIVQGKPYTALQTDPNGDYSIFYLDTTYPTVEVTAYWGYATTIPFSIKQACIMQAARWYKRLQGAMSDTLASVEAGLMIYTRSLDPDIQRLLVDGRFVRRYG